MNAAAARVADHLPGSAPIETLERSTGLPRRTRVGGAPDRNTFWVVADPASHADCVGDLEATPLVRLRIGGRWRTGTAQVLRDGHVRLRLRRVNWSTTAALRLCGTAPTVVRVDLHPPLRVAAPGMAVPGIVAGSAGDVFAFLADLSNHWRLTGPYVEVADVAHDSRGRALGAQIRIRGPFSPNAPLVTTLDELAPERRISGTARLPTGVRWRITWELKQVHNATRVVLSSRPDQRRVVDRLVHRFGGRLWWQRRFDAVLHRLATILARPRS